MTHNAIDKSVATFSAHFEFDSFYQIVAEIVADAGAYQQKKEQLMRQLSLEMKLHDLIGLVEPGLEYYYQVMPLAEVALMKCLLVLNLSSAVTGNDLKKEQDPMALTVEQDLSQKQALCVELVSCV